MTDVDLIGSHGQTAVHHPRSAGALGATLQIGEAAVIAERTGRPVVSDFRVRDVAAGGEGAPLVPLVDHLLFHPRTPGRVRALQNIGGIANVTLVGAALSELVAFDTGPGNMPLDAVARAASDGAEAFDRDGRRAARGTIDAALLAELHRHPYLAQPLPKSTGRETFGKDFVYPLLARFDGRLDDLLATLTRFVAEAIARSYREALPALPDEVYVSGGGALNPDADAPPGRAAGADPRRLAAARWASIRRPRRRSPSRCSPTRRCSAPPATSRRHGATAARARQISLSVSSRRSEAGPRGARQRGVECSSRAVEPRLGARPVALAERPEHPRRSEPRPGPFTRPSPACRAGTRTRRSWGRS